MHLAESLDHLGPMARSALDAAAILQAIAGYDPKDSTSLTDPVPDYMAGAGEGIAGIRLGIDWEYAAGGIEAEVVASLHSTLEVLERLGAKVSDVTFPWRTEDGLRSQAAFGAEIAMAHADWFPEQAEGYGPWLRGTLEAAQSIRGIDVAVAQMERERFRGRMRAMYQDIDLLLVPALGRILPTWKFMEGMGGTKPFDTEVVRFTSPFNMAGTPTITLPAGFTAEGLPIGVQLCGTWLSEPLLVRAGAAFQRETDFHERHPDLGEG
jgi:amidase